MTPGRRRVTALAVGCALAASLAAVLFAGVGTGGRPAADATLTDRAPGITPAAASLLQLNVIPPKQAVPAPAINLVDQHGRPTTLAQFRGKVVIWSLNDDQCTDLCPLLAQTVVEAERDLGAAAKDVVFLPVNSNPFYPDPSYTLAWSEKNDVETLPNWVYLTGTPTQLQKTWSDYKVTVIPDARTKTVTHDAIMQFIDPSGRARAYGYFGEGAISTAYYAHAMAQMAVDLLPKSEQVKVGGPDVEAPTTRGATIGSQAPGFDLKPLNGTGPGRLETLDRKPLVLNFWSSTCSACTTEMPALAQVQKDFAGQIHVVGVDVADPRDSAAAFARRLGVTYPLLADPGGGTAAAYRVAALPVTFIVAPGGSILARHDGTITASELEAVLQMDFQQLTAP
ncbi:MAG TPA: redoxin domain-containing protein [Acidimicrobiales bacterium]|nr:redoxin domain-containing protein [Acidimicrobiales bacterium]